MGAVTFDDEPPPAAAAAPAAESKAVAFDDEPPALTREQEIRRDALLKIAAEHGKAGVLDRAVDQYTMGMIRPISGFKTLVEGKANEWFNGGKPATAGEYWRGGVGAQGDFIKQAEENTPGPVGTAADVVGGLMSGSGGPKIAGKAALAGRAALQGAIGGASRNAEDVGSAAKGAAIGAGVDAASQSVVGALLDRFTRGARKEIGVASRGGSAQSVENDAGQIYDKLTAAGIHYKDTQTAPLAADVVQKLADAGFNPNMHKQLIPVLGEIGATQGQKTTWNQLQQMRTQIGKLMKSDDENLRRVAGEANETLDNFIKTNKPTIPAASVAAGVTNPAKDVEEARALWAKGSRAAKAEGLSEAGTRLSSDPSAKVQKNFENYTDKFVKDPTKYNPFGRSPEQMRIMDEIVAGSPNKATAGKYLDYAAKGIGGLGATATAGSLIGPQFGANEYTDKAGAPGIGMLAAAALLKGGSGAFRHAVAEQQAGKVNDLIRNIVTGSTDKSNAYVPRDALAKILAKQNLAQGVGNYVSSFTNVGEPQP